jgi:hypothetical protein
LKNIINIVLASANKRLRAELQADVNFVPILQEVVMTLQLLVILSAWLALGCAVAWLLGRTSDIGSDEDTPIAQRSPTNWFDDSEQSVELPEFTTQSRQVRIVLSRE